MCAEAMAVGFYPGSSFDLMGTHYFYDIKGDSKWMPENTMPIVPMYHPVSGRIDAFFVVSPICQSPMVWDEETAYVTTTAAFAWNLNTCNPKTDWSLFTEDGAIYTTMHVHFDTKAEVLKKRSPDPPLTRNIFRGWGVGLFMPLGGIHCAANTAYGTQN